MSRNQKRYKITINYHGLGDYESNLVNYVFDSSSPKDALRRIDAVKERCRKNSKRIPYGATQFLEALAISAEADIAGV
jgi:hypothetical protein